MPIYGDYLYMPLYGDYSFNGPIHSTNTACPYMDIQQMNALTNSSWHWTNTVCPYMAIQQMNALTDSLWHWTNTACPYMDIQQMNALTDSLWHHQHWHHQYIYGLLIYGDTPHTTNLAKAASEIRRSSLLPTPYIRDPDVVDYSSELKSKFRTLFTLLESPSNYWTMLSHSSNAIAQSSGVWSNK